MQRAALLPILLCSFLDASTTLAASFEGLGFLTPGDRYSSADAVSADGSTIVGEAQLSGARQPMRWTRAMGMEALGALPGATPNGAAGAVSDDGQFVVGTVRDAAGARRSFLVGPDTGGMTAIGDADSFGARGISRDGSVVVGRGTTPLGFIWTPTEGIQDVEEYLVDRGVELGDRRVRGATDISSDGGTILGAVATGPDGEAFVYSEARGFLGVGDLAGGSVFSSAMDLSPNGAFVVGTGSSSNGTEAYRWSEVTGILGLGDIPGGRFESLAAAVSDDGATVVGWGTSEEGQEAAIWTEAGGMQLLEVFLTAMGLDLTGWWLTQATAISADGRTIVGSGVNPDGEAEAWIAVIPEPGTSTLLGLGLALAAMYRRTDRRPTGPEHRRH